MPLLMSSLRHDLQLATRLLWKRPAFSGVVILTLAIGIGLNTAVFSVVHAMLVRPLPGVQSPDELVQLYRAYPGDNFGSLAIPDVYDLQDRSARTFTGLAGWTFAPISVGTSDRPLTGMGQLVTANFFEVLGVRPVMGRTFVADEDRGPGAHPVVVLSHAGWREHFDSDPDIVGRQIQVNGRAMDVVGVAPEGFGGAMPMLSPMLWAPLMQLDTMKPDSAGMLTSRGNRFMNGLGRLAPGVTFAQAGDQLEAAMASLRSEHPDSYTNVALNLVRQSDAGIHPTMRGAQVGGSAVVMAVVGLLLLIACVNVANLFLARAAERGREMAVRLSIGATRWHLIRQLLTESLVLAALAGAAGLLVASWAIALVNQIGVPIGIDVRPDLRLSPAVLGFAALATLATSMLFGLAPALQATRPQLVPALKGLKSGGRSRSRATQGLVMAQMALSMVLLVCAGLFLANLRSAMSVDRGFDHRDVLLANIDPGLQGYSRGRAEEFFRTLSENLTASPAVRSVAFTDAVPLGLGSADRGVAIPGYVAGPRERMSIHYSIVSPGYFGTLGVPVREGRDFTDADLESSAPVLIVNERFGERFWPGESPLGRTVHVAGADHTVVGVVPTGKYRSLGEEPLSYMFMAQAQHWTAAMSVVVHTNGDPSAVVHTLDAEVRALDSGMPLASVRTMDQHLGFTLLPARLTGVTLGVFGLIGLALASIGVYGVMAHSVGQRTREIGIRIALGSSGRGVLRLLMRQGLWVVAIGGAVGLAGAFGLSGVLRSQLYGDHAIDPLVFAGVPLVLLAVSAAAIWIPARRASRLDPLVALRNE
jgi:predicted permease